MPERFQPVWRSLWLFAAGCDRVGHEEFRGSCRRLHLARATAHRTLVVCKRRRYDLGLSQIAVDEIAGVPGGYTAKLEAGMKGLGGMSTAAILGALGLALVVVPVAELSAASIGEKHQQTVGTARDRLKKDRKERGASGGSKRGRKMTVVRDSGY